MTKPQFKKTILKVLGGYIIGVVIVTLILTLSGDALRNVIKLLILWLPINAAYSFAIVLLLRQMGIAQMPWMFELCGTCIGAMPLFSGLWPIYWMRWDVALAMVVIQCLGLTLVVSFFALLQKIVGSD